MRIDNNYTQRQPNFGRLNSINYCNNTCRDLYPKEIAELLNTIKESKGFNKFFKQYDVDLFINNQIGKHSFVNMTLKTAVPEIKNPNLYPELKFGASADPKELVTCYTLFRELTQTIKKLEFSDLKNKLDDSLKEMKELEYRAGKKDMYRAEIDEITKSLLTQDSPETPKKKTFFQKLFGWLK